MLLFMWPWLSDYEKQLPASASKVFPFCASVSRLEYNPATFNCVQTSDTIKQLLTYPNHNYTFSQLADQRALELEEKNEKIYVMWSGGLDSTVAVTSILKNWNHTNLERLVILCTPQSINECRHFFQLLVSPPFNTKIKIQGFNGFPESYLEDGYLITGEMGDQIFGSDTVGFAVQRWGDSVIHAPWRRLVPDIFRGISATHGNHLYEKFEPIIHEAPSKIVTVQDFFWWINFTQKWAHVKYRIMTFGNWKTPQVTFKKVIHFFDNIPFQVWSMHNPDQKIKRTWLSYKFAAKEYIVEYTKLQQFHDQLKVPSQGHLWIGHQLNWAIDEQFNFMSKQQALECCINE